MNDGVKPTIEERENGPLVVKGLETLQGPDGEALEVKPVMALCRCGFSKSKPFCDGSHNEVGFKSDSGTPAGKNRLLEYAGDEVTVTYNPLVCAHIGECGKRQPEVFNPDQRPWIQPDKGDRAASEDAVRHCPSGALALRQDGKTVHLYEEGAQIEVLRNGPYVVRDVAIAADHPGEGTTPRKYVLCRCGLSGIKPFCDGTHHDEKWTSDD